MQKRIDASTLDLKERLVSINRVAKVVKGGRNFRFSALMVVGDENGHVGVGMGKAAEIPEAVRKGVEDAKRHMIEIPLVGTSIPIPLEQTSYEMYGGLLSFLFLGLSWARLWAVAVLACFLAQYLYARRHGRSHE